MEVDFLIIGQGLAGSTLALQLRRQNARVMVVDRADAGSATRVAAGLITPITGKGMNPAWRQAEYLPAAKAFYDSLDPTLWNSCPAVRVFLSEKEREKWHAKEETCHRWAKEIEIDDTSIHAPYGGLIMDDAAWLDTVRFLDFAKQEFYKDGSWMEGDFAERNLSLTEHHVIWNQIRAKKIILCQGAYGLGKQSEGDSWFSHIPHRSAKGEILTIKHPALTTQQRYHYRGSWLAPRGSGVWKAGATYEWDDLNSEITAEGQEKILQQLGQWVDNSQANVIDHAAGVRPIVRNSRPVVGLHPTQPKVGFFNGLGSKGSLMAPAVAEHFAGFLMEKHPLDDELNVACL